MARAFNAFLEGQVRDSDVRFESSELEPILFHLWLGATTTLKNGLSVSYSVHRQTEEIQHGRGARELEVGQHRFRAAVLTPSPASRNPDLVARCAVTLGFWHG